MMCFVIVLYPGFDELDAIAPFEVLATAAQLGAPFDVKLAALSSPATMCGSHGLTVQVEHTLGDTACDWLIVPGGPWSGRLPVGTWAEIERGALPRALAAQRARGVSLASVCTGAMLLSAAGVTRARAVTTHRSAKEALASEGACVLDARVVDDGDLITAGGVTSGLDLALWMVERFGGKEVLARVEELMEIRRSPSLHVSADEAL